MGRGHEELQSSLRLCLCSICIVQRILKLCFINYKLETFNFACSQSLHLTTPLECSFDRFSTSNTWMTVHTYYRNCHSSSGYLCVIRFCLEIKWFVTVTPSHAFFSTYRLTR